MKGPVLLLKKAAAETIGTFALVFAGCGVLMVAERFPGTVTPAAVPWVFGLVIAAMVYALGHISGAHFNPAVTLGFAVARHFPLKEVVVYWAAQFIGGLLAIRLLIWILPAGETFGAAVAQVPVLQALAWEAVLTFLLMFVIMAVATDTRAVGVMAGAAINPARSFAPALAQGTLLDCWIYLVGPAIGAVAAALLYEWIRCEPSAEASKAKGCC